MKILALLITAVILSLSVPVVKAASYPFPKSRNYMSCAGEYRLDVHQQTGKWITYKEARRLSKCK